MKLLFDHNLSRHLVRSLADVFPDSTHVSLVGLERADDAIVWDYAAKHGYTIVSKDTDFHQRSFLLGHPPKVVWLRIGNSSTRDIERLLRRYAGDMISFEHDRDVALLVLS